MLRHCVLVRPRTAWLRMQVRRRLGEIAERVADGRCEYGNDRRAGGIGSGARTTDLDAVVRAGGYPASCRADTASARGGAAAGDAAGPHRHRARLAPRA